MSAEERSSPRASQLRFMLRAFAYPNGRPGDDYTERDRDIVRELGFECALSTWWGAASAKSDFFQLPRFTPWDQDPARWLARLLLGFSKADTLAAAKLR